MKHMEMILWPCNLFICLLVFDRVLAEEYFTNRDKYNQKAKEWTKTHAGMSLEDREKVSLLSI